MNLDLIIKNGDIITPTGEQRLDVGIRDGKITMLESAIEAPAKRTIDARGKLVFPGFIDAHTHMGIPIMDTHSCDDFESGSVAAAFGGVTTIIDFTVHEKDQTLKESLDVRMRKAEKCHVDFSFHINITDEPERCLWEIPELVDGGIRSFKVFSTYREAGMMVTWEQFAKILEKVNDAGALLMLHAEDNEVIESMTNAFSTGEATLPMLHAMSRPPDAESSAIHTATEIAGDLGACLYIVHVSSFAGLEAGLEAKRQGVDVILETCPQYLILTDECYRQKNGHYWITTPPLRSQEDSEALWSALSEEAISVVATDHCPFTRGQKDAAKGVFYRIPNGLPGVETLFPLLYTYGVVENRISLQQMVRVLAESPAKIFGLYPRKGVIAVGADADLVIWDPDEKHVIPERLHGKADWSPYAGMEIAGKLQHTILRGQTLVEHDRFEGESIFGEFIPATPP